MPVVNMHEAKTHLAELVRRVQQGETFIIARAGRPVAQLIRLGASPLPRRPGSLAGVLRMDEEVGMPVPAVIHGPADDRSSGSRSRPGTSCARRCCPATRSIPTTASSSLRRPWKG